MARKTPEKRYAQVRITDDFALAKATAVDLNERHHDDVEGKMKPYAEAATAVGRESGRLTTNQRVKWLNQPERFTMTALRAFPKARTFAEAEDKYKAARDAEKPAPKRTGKSGAKTRKTTPKASGRTFTAEQVAAAVQAAISALDES